MRLTIYHTAFHPAYFTQSCEKGPRNGTILANGKIISPIPFQKRTTSGGCSQFPKNFSGKLPFHLTSNRNLSGNRCVQVTGFFRVAFSVDGYLSQRDFVKKSSFQR